VAKVEKSDRGLEIRMDEFEQRLFVLKIEYEKYFSGLERIEPAKERDDLRRLMREIEQLPVKATRQLHRVRSLKARFSSMELYWTRNLVQIERGTHPKQKFKAKVHEAERGIASESPSLPRPKPLTEAEREDQALRQVFERYLEVRKECGQTADLGFDSVRDVLQKQVRTIKSRYGCAAVKFKVAIEDGKAKVKAIPVK
jgi:hypothetical protein